VRHTIAAGNGKLNPPPLLSFAYFASASTLQTMPPLSIIRLEADGATVWLSVKGANAAPSFLVKPVIRGYAI